MAVDDVGYDDVVFNALKNMLKENPMGVAALSVTLNASGEPFAENPGPTIASTYYMGQHTDDSTSLFLDLTGLNVRAYQIITVSQATTANATALRVAEGAATQAIADTMLTTVAAGSLAGYYVMPIVSTQSAVAVNCVAGEWQEFSKDPKASELASIATRVDTEGTTLLDVYVRVR